MLEIRRNPSLDGGLTAAIVSLWVEVSNAGGAVGFVPPVEDADVEPVATAALARVRQGHDDLVVAHDGPQLVGFGFLALNELALHRHWATVKRLQRRPGRRYAGTGTRLLEELEAAARDRGLERVVLTVRGGTGIERFYLGRGYVVDATLPGRLKVAGGHVADELYLSKVLAPGPGRSGTPQAGGAVLRVRRLDPDLPLPAYAHPGDAGLDLHAREDVTLGPGERALVPTGVAIALPPGHVGLVHPRSGLAARHGLGMVNAPGTVDEGYRGELKVILVNHDPTESVTLHRGDRIAQLLVQRVEHVAIEEVADLDSTARGPDGFGSTGR